jgi:endoglucanase
MENCVEGLVKVWLETNPSDPNGVVSSPGGLRYRKNAPNTFTIQRMLTPTYVAGLWTAYRPAEKQKYLDYVQSQIDYILGNNPLEKSLLIGYDNDGTREFLSVVHHRGAYGAWENWDHFDSRKPLYNRDDECRHILYGGFLLGVNAPKDSFTKSVMNHVHSEVAIATNSCGQGLLAFLIANGKGEGQPLPDNAFPAPEQRNDNTDIVTTDREFFVVAKKTGEGGEYVEIEAKVHNRSRWPARRTGGITFRYWFKQQAGASGPYTSRIISSDVTAQISDAVMISDDLGYFEITFPGDTIQPFYMWNDLANWANHRKVKFRIGAASWEESDDWSYENLASNEAILPKFPVYQDGALVGGEEPEEAVVTKGTKLRISTKPVIKIQHVSKAGLLIEGALPHANVVIFSSNGRAAARGKANARGACNMSISNIAAKGMFILKHAGQAQRFIIH